MCQDRRILFIFKTRPAHQKDARVPIEKCPASKCINALSDTYKEVNSSEVFVHSSVWVSRFIRITLPDCRTTMRNLLMTTTNLLHSITKKRVNAKIFILFLLFINISHYICNVLFRYIFRCTEWKGNRVKVPDSPAAVSSWKVCLMLKPLPLRWEGKQTGVSQKTCKTISCFDSSRKG